MKMLDSMIVFGEPELEFRYGQKLRDPHDGLALFGPCDADSFSRPGSLSHIVLGTEAGIAQFHLWSEAMMRPAMLDVREQKANLRLWSPYPGFEATFSCSWSPRSLWSYSVDEAKLLNAAHNRERYRRTYDVVDLYMEGLRIAANKLDQKPRVAICIVPDEIYQFCRPQSTVAKPIGEKVSSKTLKSRKRGQFELSLYGEAINLDIYQLSPDFRRQLKARAMEYDIPVQIIRQSTLRLSDQKKWGQRTLTPLSDRMWNISTALYYKCGGRPWRLVTARDGVCYIGIAFRRTDSAENQRSACCAAQMFLDDGDGIVFLGNFGPWFSPEKKQFQLTPTSAYELLHGTLKTYQELNGKALTEIFLHSRSNISHEEFQGYQKACPEGVKLVGIRVRPFGGEGIRLFRPGEMALLRGSFLKINERSGLLWGNGFKERLATYDGWEVPLPLQIDIQHGDACIERVAQDIFGLTKLNYNACRLGESQPVTVGFSDAVGEILVSNPAVSARRPNFKFYI